MRTLLKTTLAALPLVSLLGVTPPAAAHDTHRSHEQRRSWADSSSHRDPATGLYRDSYRDPATGLYRDPYRDPATGPSRDWKRRRGSDASCLALGICPEIPQGDESALTPRTRSTHKSYRRYEGNQNDPRFRERLAEIDRRSDRKRYQVERNRRHD
jgi:hypothetical protein